jgi:hypothetical protein
MQPDASAPSNNDAQPGLPPVKPPSGRFILQLFLIPGLIVAGLVLVFVFGGLAWVGTSSPQSFLDRLDSNNPDIRWRAAHELAQVLKRPESLEMASNPKFALDIAERLERASVELERDEYAAKADLKKVLDKIDRDRNLTTETKIQRGNEAALAAWRKLTPQRDLVLFLTSSLGDFTIPVGVHVLSEMVMQDKSAEEKGLVLKRRRAVWALANLGDNMQRHYFGKKVKPDDRVLDNDQKTTILAELDKEAAAAGGLRSLWAQTAMEILQNKRPAGVDAAMEICVRGNDKIKPAEDLFLRELVAFALNFWDGPRVEPTLLWLAHDDGHGKLIEIDEGEG